MAHIHDLGQEGEDLAVRHLIGEGYTVLERNWKFGKEEIDIIAERGDEIIFVEVKTRKTNFYGMPEVFVGKAKQRIIIRAANAYILRHNIHKEARFDVVGVIINSRERSVNHLEGAFAPGM